MSIAIGIGATSCGTAGIQRYPDAPQTPDTIDTYFDLEVRDLYRPLENDTSAATLAWVEAERKVTSDYLATFPKGYTQTPYRTARLHQDRNALEIA